MLCALRLLAIGLMLCDLPNRVTPNCDSHTVELLNNYNNKVMVNRKASFLLWWDLFDARC